MFQGGGLDASLNLQIMDSFLADCSKARSCDVVVFPELFLCGYDNAPFESALDARWESSGKLKEIVTRHDIAVVVGLAEREGAHLYNTVAFFQGNGKLLLKHRKTHLWGEFERAGEGKGKRRAVCIFGNSSKSH
jgi:predicted amidohydrolase